MKSGLSIYGSFVYVTRDEDDEVFELIEEQARTRDAALSSCMLDTFLQIEAIEVADNKSIISPIMCYDEEKGVAVIAVGDVSVNEPTGNELQALMQDVMFNIEHNKDVVTISQTIFMAVFKKNRQAMEDVLRARKNGSSKKIIQESTTIWKLKSPKDYFKYSSIAKMFYLYNKEYYLEANKDILLDDFLDKGDPDAVKGKPIAPVKA